MKCIVEFRRVFHVQCGEAWKRTDAFFQNTFQLQALIVTTRVLPMVARTGVNLDDIVVRQEDVRRINLCVATPVDNAFGQWLIPMGATMIPNIAKAGNIKRADTFCQRLLTSISIPRGYDHPPQGCIIVIIVPVIVQGVHSEGVIHMLPHIPNAWEWGI